MDSKNFFTSWTVYQLMRLEWLAGFVAIVVILVMHIGEIRWIPAIILFVYIDVIGYIPGAIASRRISGPTPKLYYVLYNTAHSPFSMAAVLGLWWLFVGPEWAMLAVPLHLCADRGINGNFLKTFSLEFEPHTHPAWARFQADLVPAETSAAAADHAGRVGTADRGGARIGSEATG